MPSVTRSVEVDHPEAVLLADLYEIVSDLKAAAEWCSRAVKLSEQEQRDWFHEEALVTAAVVKYGRCFTKGVRLWLNLEDLAALDMDLRGAHDYFIALRNKFVAHAVNAFEETYVTANAREKDGVRFQVTSVHPGSHKLMLTGETASALANVISAVRGIIDQRVKAEEARVLSFIQSLPIDVVHSWDLHSPASITHDKVEKTRPRGVNAQIKSGKVFGGDA